MKRRNALQVLVGLAIVLVIVGALLPATQRIRETPWGELRFNQRSIAIATENYSRGFDGILPHGTSTDLNDREMHGWMSAILPYADEDRVYRMIRFDLPWQAPENRPAFREPIRTYFGYYELRRTDDAGFALTHFEGNSHVLLRGKSLPIKDVTDGRSHTILLGEVSAGFKPWGHPVNLRDPAAGIGATHEQFGTPRPSTTVLFTMLDGSVRSIKATVSPAVLKALATPAGGEKIDDSDW